MKKLTYLLTALIALAMMVSCVKEGPMGPQGPTGPTGPTGPQGPSGNANVASSTITVYSDDWYWDNTSWRVDFDYSAINNDIYNSGVVLIFMESDGTWRQLPMTFYYSELNSQGETVYYSSSLETSFYLGGASVFWTESDFYDGYRPDTHQFRLVAIAASYAHEHPEVVNSDYETLKETFQLAD